MRSVNHEYDNRQNWTNSFLPIDQNYEKIWEGNLYWLYIFVIRKTTVYSARQQRADMMRSVYLHRHDVLTVPLTALLHCPVTSMSY